MRNGNELTTTLQRNLPPGEGYGYRLQGSTDGNQEASYFLQNNIGTYEINAARNQSDIVTRLNASGGIAMLGSDPFLSRRIDQSFAVVRIPDYAKVRVLADNQLAGSTNADGNALIPRLRAYDNNMISIDQRDLPLDAEINTLQLDAVPYYRSGIEVKFPIKHSRGATLTIHLENGKPLPVGASVQEVGKEGLYAVGYEGEVYIVGLASTTTLRATWDNHSCTFDVSFSASSNPLPDLGIYICKVVAP
jgi:outer membrane usher protein